MCFVSFSCSIVSYLYVTAVADLSPRLGKRKHSFLLSLTYVTSVMRSFLFLLVLGMGCVIL